MAKTNFVENKVYVGFFLFLLIFLAKIPTVALDYHWDATAVAGQSKYYAENGFLSVPPGVIVHTPFLTWTLALIYLVFTETSVVSNLIILIFSFIGAFFLYLLGRDIYGPKAGFFASIMLFLSPMYFSLSGQTLYDVPLTAMTITTLYFSMKGNSKLYLLSASILVLTKEPGFLAVLAILFCSAKRKNIKNLLIKACPLALLLAWGLFVSSNIEKIGAGGYFSQNYSPAIFIQKALFIFYQTAIWNYNWIPLLITAFLLIKSGEQINSKIKPILLTAAIYFFAFTFSPTFLLPKYLLPIMPAFYLLASNYITKMKKGHIMAILIIALFLSTYRFNWGAKGALQDPIFSGFFSDKPISSIRSSELSLDYADILSVEGEALNYLFLNYKNITIVSTHPLAEDASIASNVGRRQWKANNITVFTMPSEENINRSKLVIVESYGSFGKEVLDKIQNKTLLNSFKNNQKQIDVYEIGHN